MTQYVVQYLYRYWKAWGTELVKRNFPVVMYDSRPKACIYLSKFPVHSQTAKTYKIEGDDGRIRNVLKGDGKRYAHETKEQAWYSFQKRLTHEHAHLSQRLVLVNTVRTKTIDDIEPEYVELT